MIQLELADATNEKIRFNGDIKEKYMYVNVKHIVRFWEQERMATPGRYTDDFELIIEPEYISIYYVELSTGTILQITEKSYNDLILDL